MGPAVFNTVVGAQAPRRVRFPSASAEEVVTPVPTCAEPAQRCALPGDRGCPPGTLEEADGAGFRTAAELRMEVDPTCGFTGSNEFDQARDEPE